MACVPRVVSFCSAITNTTQHQRQQRHAARGSRRQCHHQQPRRGAVVGPFRATRRGWGNTDNRFSRLDKRREGGEGAEREYYRDTEKNISFQELRRRQDREQRKVSHSGHVCKRKLIAGMGTFFFLFSFFPHEPPPPPPFFRFVSCRECFFVCMGNTNDDICTVSQKSPTIRPGRPFPSHANQPTPIVHLISPLPRRR